MHNINHVHVDEEALETTLAISSLRSGKHLPDPYKDHLIYHGLVEEEETPMIVEHNSDLEDEEEQATSKPNPDKYKPLVTYNSKDVCFMRSLKHTNVAQTKFIILNSQ